MSKTAEVDLDQAMRKRREAAQAGRGKQTRLQAMRDEPAEFVGKRELAHHLQGDIASIGDWIAKGTVPPPWFRPGDRHPLWKRDHFDHLVKTGSWPRAAFHQRPV